MDIRSGRFRDRPESATPKLEETWPRAALSPKLLHARLFLYSEIANLNGMPNIPDDPDLAIVVGTQLCEKRLEPLNCASSSAASPFAPPYRSSAVNAFGNANGLNCAKNGRRTTMGTSGTGAMLYRIGSTAYASLFRGSRTSTKPGADWQARCGLVEFTTTYPTRDMQFSRSELRSTSRGEGGAGSGASIATSSQRAG